MALGALRVETVGDNGGNVDRQFREPRLRAPAARSCEESTWLEMARCFTASALTLGTKNREPKTEPKKPRTGAEPNRNREVRFHFGSWFSGTENTLFGFGSKIG